MKRFAILVVAMALGLAGCQTENAYTGEQQTSNATQGAAIGAVAGAALGALTHTHGKGAGKNALIGGAVGALAGGLVGNYMDNQETELRQQLRASGVSVRRLGNEIVLVMRDSILFQTNSFQLSGHALRTVDAVSRVLNHYDRTLINVNGYTDTTGAPDYNLKLSRKRAEAVADVLVDDGVNPRRISPRGYGETHLAVPTGDNVDEPRNRRVEIHIVPHTASS
jgi:outer membrane protein OmpA-like peptidoglycan-associated protein